MAAWNAGDGAAFALLFSGEAVYRSADGAMHRGRVAIARLLRGAGAHVQVDGPVEVREQDEGAVVAFDWSMAGTDRAGRITCQVSRHGGGWRIDRLENLARPAQKT